MKPASISTLCLMVCSLSLSSCSGSNQSSRSQTARKKVVVLSPHGQEMLDEYEAAFEAAYPDIDVVGRFVPTGQILGQLLVDKDSPQADIWWGGTSAFFGLAKSEGLLQPYRPSWAKSSHPLWRDPQDYWYAQFLQVPAVMYNSNIHDYEHVPRTWNDLLKPEWKNKIVIREPKDSGTIKTIFSGIIWSLGGVDEDTRKGYQFLSLLDAQTKSYLPNPQALYDRIAKSPEGYISIWNVTDIIYQAEVNHYPFGYRIPPHEVPISLDPIGIVAGAPHLAEAKLFYEFVTSKRSCLKLARDHFRIPARMDIKKNELPERMRILKDINPIKFNINQFDRPQTEWMNHWAKSIRDPKK